MRGLLATLLLAVAALALPGAGAAQDSPYPAGPYAPWDGSNPFNCVSQDVGLGVGFPDPGADPFCVEFDKTQQNVTDFGILDFLANEPARVAAAVPKCFYYQHDHWRGSVVQGEEPELWNWDGSYFFDKARAVGGVHVDDFRILGQPASPAAYGEVPEEFAGYINDGGGGVYLIGDVPADPSCVAKVDTPAEAAEVYGPGSPPPLPGGGQSAPATGPAQPGAAVKGATRSKRCRKGKRRAGASARKRCRKQRF